MSKEEFLHRLAYDELSDEQVVQEFSRHYIIRGLAIRDVCHEICLMASMTAANEVGKKLELLFQRLAGEDIPFQA